MRFCSNCGMQLDDSVRFCSNCRATVNEANQQNQQYYQQPNYQQPNYYPQSQPKPDEPNTGLKVLSFFIPLAGLILFLVNQKDQPVSAKAYGKMALISFIISIVFYIAYFVFIGVIVGTGALESFYFQTDLLMRLL